MGYLYPNLGYVANTHNLERMAKQLNAQRRQHIQMLLRSVREEAGLRQIDVAKRLNEPQSFVSKYESGERRLDVAELDQVCHALGITLPDFVRLMGKQ